MIENYCISSVLNHTVKDELMYVFLKSHSKSFYCSNKLKIFCFCHYYHSKILINHFDSFDQTIPFLNFINLNARKRNPLIVTPLTFYDQHKILCHNMYHLLCRLSSFIMVDFIIIYQKYFFYEAQFKSIK